MTQAQFAQWLGVSIKQVKYLEHQRRNPSGPTRRLLGILAQQLDFEGSVTVQVLGASQPQKKLPARAPKMEDPLAKKADVEGVNGSTMVASKTKASVPHQNIPAPPTDDEAFVWL